MKDRSRANDGTKIKVDYTQRHREPEKLMQRENRDLMIWKDRLRKEREGFSK